MFGVLSTVLALVLMACIVSILWDRFNRWVLKYPPGPIPFPLIGNIHQIDPISPMDSFSQFAAKYGPIAMIYFGKTPAVIVSDPQGIYEVFVKNGASVNAREKPPFCDEFPIDKGINFASGRVWEINRKTF
jgi:cytochrome P450 family 2 subfamily D